MSHPEWNPYYVAYARAHHVDDPQEMLRRDECAHPGGKMTSFILWIAEQRAAFKRTHPEAFLFDGIVDTAAWGQWLDDAKDRRDS